MSRLFKDKYSRLELAIYTVGWIILLSFPILTQSYDVLTGKLDAFHWGPILKTLELTLPILIMFVINDRLLLPLLFFGRRNKIWYVTAIVGLFVILWCIQTPPPLHHHDAEEIARRRPPTVDMFHIVLLILELCVVFANFAMKIYVKSMRRDMAMLKIQTENVQTELESLKYQISPHFLMNTLNNIQSLIEIDPQRACHTIQELSKMMRYLLYDNDSANVSLIKEIEFMRHFIDLMKIRYPDSVRIYSDFPSNDPGVMIPPLLFVSFIENAFKYGVSYSDESFINVSLTVTDDRLNFRCSNSINRRRSASSGHKRRGIGIENVRRRLDLIYGSRYELSITDNERVYTVEMKLPVNRIKNQ